MAHSSFLFLLFCCLLFTSSTLAQTPIKPKGLIIQVSKDSSTLQYLTQIKQRTPPVPVPLTLDLGGQFLWVDCDQGYTTSTYRPARCNSAQCSLANAHDCMIECYSARRPGCTNNTCVLLPSNSVAHSATSGTVGSDVLSVQSASDGTSVSVSQFLFVCGSTFLLGNLASGVKGMAGLGRTRISLPSQFSSSFSFNKKFAVCLSSSSSSNGAVFFGDVDSSTAPLTHTPLLINPISTAAAYSVGDASAEYFIGVKSIKINDKSVPVDSKLLSINTSDGTGGTAESSLISHALLFCYIENHFYNQSNVYNYGLEEDVIHPSFMGVMTTLMGVAVVRRLYGGNPIKQKFIWNFTCLYSSKMAMLIMSSISAFWESTVLSLTICPPMFLYKDKSRTTSKMKHWQIYAHIGVVTLSIWFYPETNFEVLQWCNGIPPHDVLLLGFYNILEGLTCIPIVAKRCSVQLVLTGPLFVFIQLLILFLWIYYSMVIKDARQSAKDISNYRFVASKHKNGCWFLYSTSL